ncbi:hypothetical protein [Streptomyces sp. V4I8]|uniref:hypothetical protein n=1 Tax=Streptomyces sp. V4I8 TaxID=3156469 RepID=UPI003516AC9F
MRDADGGRGRLVAERISAEALAFVATCARFSGEGLRPSRVVDEGWHGLILHPAPYARLCRRLGWFAHHRPEQRDPNRHNTGELERTWAASSGASSRTCPSSCSTRRSASAAVLGRVSHSAAWHA